MWQTGSSHIIYEGKRRWFKECHEFIARVKFKTICLCIKGFSMKESFSLQSFPYHPVYPVYKRKISEHFVAVFLLLFSKKYRKKRLQQRIKTAEASKTMPTTSRSGPGLSWAVNKSRSTGHTNTSARQCRNAGMKPEKLETKMNKNVLNSCWMVFQSEHIRCNHRSVCFLHRTNTNP